MDNSAVTAIYLWLSFLNHTRFVCSTRLSFLFSGLPYLHEFHTAWILTGPPHVFGILRFFVFGFGLEQIDRNIISTKPFLELQATIPNTNENKSDFDYMSKFITNPPHLLVIHLRIPPFSSGKRQTRVIMALFQNFHAWCSVSQMNYRKSMKSKLFFNIFRWLQISLFS